MGLAIARKLTDAGYRMLGDDTSIERLIQDILKTESLRYLKAIPFLLYKYDIDINKIRQKTKKIELLNTILDITAGIFHKLDIRKNIPRSARGDAALKGHYAEKYASYFNEFKDEFELQLRNDRKPDLLIDTQKNDEERNLQYGLSQLFTKKEKYIIKRLQKRKPVSRTDYEYYSRKTKKKLKSIIILENFAKNIYTKTPEIDETLFELKNQLEKWLSEKWQTYGSIEEFHLSKDNITISLKNKLGDISTAVWSLNKIKNKKFLAQLRQYGSHDFR